MRKLKLLMAACALVGSAATAWAQTDVTSTYLTNADFSSTSGWTQEHSNDYWSLGNGQIGTYAVANDKTSTTDGTHLSTEYCLGIQCRWKTNYANFAQTTNSLPAGAYTLTYDVQNTNASTSATYNNLFKVTVGGTTYTDSKTEWMSGSSSWTTHTIEFILSEAATATISLGYGTGSNNFGSGSTPHLYVSHLKLTQTPFATANDYSALNTAISTVEAITWGFDAGEYAPYKYSEIIDALADAKAIDQDANNSQVTVQALTATLNTSMTANAEEVNAIFDGSFKHDYSGQSGNVQPIGWYRTKGTTGDGYNVRYVTSSGNAGMTTVGGYGMFTKFAAYYGWADGYTLPLNASTYYTVSFKYGGWGDCKKDGYVTMTDPESASLSLISSNRLPLSSTDANSNTESWTNYSAIFRTNDAGNYVLGLRKDNESQQSQYVYGNFVLKTTTVAEATTYYNSVLDEVDDSYDAGANGGTEKTAFKAAIDADVSGYTVEQLMSAAANLYTLRDAFVAATPYYNRYLAEKANAERIATSITFGVSTPTTVAEADAALKTILVNEYNYVANNFNADAAAYYGITIDQWTGTATSGGNSDTPKTNSNEKWGTSATTYYEQGYSGWSSSAWTLNYSKTVTLPANTYVLKVAARASENVTATLSATIGETTITEALPNVGANGKGITTSGVASFDDGDFARDGEGYGWQWRYLAFTLESEGEVTLQIDASVTGHSHEWCSFGDVAVVSNVTTDALETAYNNFTMHTLGFENGQYAPYNNVDLLEAYANAKAIVVDGAVPSTQAAVDALTTTLTAAAWSEANDGDVNAIYNGTFAQTGTGNNPKGWTRSNNGWGQQITGLTAAANGVDSETTTAWYYNNNGAWQYGNDGVYTMPLAGNQAYVLKFKYRKNGSDWQTWMKASVQNDDEEGLAAVEYPGAADGTSFESATAYFSTGAAGNYILSIENNGNAHLTDVSLEKAASTTQTISETATSVQTENYVYADVQLTRTLSASNWNTFSVPFDMAIPEGWTVKEFDSATDNVISFKTATTIVAGKPYLVKPTANVVNPTYNGVIVQNTAGTTDGEGDYKFAAQIYNKTLATDGTIAYLATDGTVKKLTSGSIKGLRAYFIIPAGASGARIAFIDGDETTGISEMKSLPVSNDTIYDLNGRRVQNMGKGIYVVNGKKVVK